MATSKKAQHNRENGATATKQTASSEGKAKAKAYNLLGWRYFGLFKPIFKLGLRHKNPEYEKGYN